MANEFDTTELIELRTFTGYPQPIGDMPLSDAQSVMEAKLQSMGSDYADAVRSSFLEPLRAHQKALLDSHKKMSYASVDGAYERNSNELLDRTTLIDSLRRGLCQFIGVPAGPGLSSGPGFVQARAVR